MRIVSLILLLSLISPIYSQKIKNMDAVQKIITEIQEKYAPDTRTSLFEINFISAKEDEVIVNGETNLPAAKEDLIKELKKAGYKLNDKISVLPGNEFGENKFGVITLSVASLRTKPEHSAELATQALLGSRVILLKKSEGWVLVQTPDKYIAWIEPESYKKMNLTQLNELSSSKRIIITKEFSFCYSEKNISSEPVSDLSAGNLLKELDRDNDYVKVEYPDKRTGYVPAGSCEVYSDWLKSQQPTDADIIKTAKRFLGVPYLWGGTSSKLMDCSGFTRTVFLLNGIYLPRDASQQENVGIPIDIEKGFDNLKPGDLLFFGRKATDLLKEKITHVGIYIGDGDFIHESGMVKINSFDRSKENFSNIRLDQFISARRIINSTDLNGVKLLKNIEY